MHIYVCIMYVYMYAFANLLINAIVGPPHPRGGDSQRQEINIYIKRIHSYVLNEYKNSSKKLCVFFLFVVVQHIYTNLFVLPFVFSSFILAC